MHRVPNGEDTSEGTVDVCYISQEGANSKISGNSFVFNIVR